VLRYDDITCVKGYKGTPQLLSADSFVPVHIMLVRKFAALLCSGVLATSALTLSALYDLYDSAVESALDSSDARQIPLGASRVLSQDDIQDVHDDFENDKMQFLPQNVEDQTIYQVLSDNPK